MRLQDRDQAQSNSQKKKKTEAESTRLLSIAMTSKEQGVAVIRAVSLALWPEL